ncbi:MAG TPA: carboxylating nicotinate-nucleotide diphosphorylase [Thermoanaerobaculia bacterium]|nr:carboxylating nicotinate-nucleotide diphosphorylase [Thermoanaerobaculia bacterium]
MSATGGPEPYRLLWEPLLRAALAEDLGRAGDVTSDAILPPGLPARARLVARKPGRIAGLGISLATFGLLSPDFEIEVRHAEGTDADAAATLALIQGPAREMLSAERTCLNLLGHLSGIATATARLVEAVRGTRAQIVCTRKTTPGLRALEKYAVRMGGGANHRFGLDDAVLIKDNHRAVAGSIGEAVARARRAVGHLVKVEIEVDALEQIDEALAAGVDAILLDNMEPATLAEAVRRIAGRAITEASGGITLETAPAIAATGVDLLSVGWITHSAPNLDVALDVEV